MNKEIKELDERGYLIYFKSSWGAEHWFEYDKNNKQIEISKKEFEQIKRNRENIRNREIINNSKISRFELMDI